MVALCRSMYHEPFWEKALGFAPMSQLCYSLLFSSMIVLAHHMCHFFWQKVSLWACSFVQCNFYRTNPRFWKWMDGIGFPICEPTYQGPINGWLFIDNHQASFVTMNHEVCQFLHLVLLRGHWGFIIVNTGISTNRYNWLEKRLAMYLHIKLWVSLGGKHKKGENAPTGEESDGREKVLVGWFL